MKTLTQWRKDNGLNYKGWWKWVIIKFLRRHGLMFIIPFYYGQDDYDDGTQVLYVWRWGKHTKEIWYWRSGDRFNTFDRMQRSHEFSKRTLYKIITMQAELKQSKDLN